MLYDMKKAASDCFSIGDSRAIAYSVQNYTPINGSRLWCLRGWKPNELADMHGNSGVPSISFGPGLQQAFADGTMDKGDLVRKIQELGWKVIE